MRDKLIDFVPIGESVSVKYVPPIEADDFDATGKIFIQNPFYDKVFILLFDKAIRTGQTKKKEQRDLHKQLCIDMAKEVSGDSRFPSKHGALVVLQFFAPLLEIRQLDVDNLAKFMIDAIKGRFLLDDRQICMLWVDKKPDSSMRGCKVAIKIIGADGLPMLIPHLYCEAPAQG